MGLAKGSPASRATSWRTLLVPAVGGAAKDGPAEPWSEAWASALPGKAKSGATAAATVNPLRLKPSPDAMPSSQLFCLSLFPDQRKARCSHRRGAGDLRQKTEETLFTGGIDAPIHRQTLI